MSTTAIAASVEIGAALIGAGGAITAALIGLRGNRSLPPAVVPPFPNPLVGDGHVAAAAAIPAVRRISRSFWWGLAGMVLWVIPAIGIFAVVPGLYIGTRDLAPARGRKWALAGIILSGVALLFLLVNSAEGYSAGAHEYVWYQQ